MSSIRPLATITVLAFVGVFLYLKINETEPPLPAGVEDWSANTDIQFDMGGNDLASIPDLDAPSMAGDAPAYSAEPNTVAPPAVDMAPTFAPTPSGSTTPPFAAQPAPPAVDETAGVSDLPPMPSLPPAPSTAPSTEVDTQTGSVTPSDAAVPTTPPSAAAPTTPATNTAQAQSSSFSATRLAVQAALDRGELSQALLLLSDWYGDPSLSAEETTEVNTLLGQLAGSVIYSTEHRLEPPYMVQAGERLETIAKKYDVPWQLLAKINGITSADQLQPGQELKVVRGPFSATVDISQRRMTLMLDRRYAGRFALDVDTSVTVEGGSWEVSNKLLTPASSSPTGGSTLTEERSLMLSNVGGGAAQVAILRGAVAPNPLSAPAERVLRMNPTDAEDVFDILSVGSRVVIRR